MSPESDNSKGGYLENCWNRLIGYHTICASQMWTSSHRSWHNFRQASKSFVGPDGQFSMQAAKEPPGHGSGDGDGEGEQLSSTAGRPDRHRRGTGSHASCKEAHHQ